MGFQQVLLPVTLAACAALGFSNCGDKATTSPTPSVLNIAGTWNVAFVGTIVQRNDGGPLGSSQTDTFVMSIQQSAASITGVSTVSGIQIPFSGTLVGTRFTYRGDVMLGTCPFTIQADTTLNGTADGFTGSQTQSTCEGRAEGRVTGTKRT